MTAPVSFDARASQPSRVSNSAERLTMAIFAAWECVTSSIRDRCSRMPAQMNMTLMFPCGGVRAREELMPTPNRYHALKYLSTIAGYGTMLSFSL